MTGDFWKHYPEYMTHVPALAAAVAHTTGPVLELGCGHGSTPLLHAMCQPTARVLCTVESDSHWAEPFAGRFTAPWHGFYHCGADDWDTGHPVLTLAAFHLVFIDHGNRKQRGASLAMCAAMDSNPVVVVHDAHATDFYCLTEPLKLFPHQAWYRGYWPHTVILRREPPFPFADGPE